MVRPQEVKEERLPQRTAPSCLPWCDVGLEIKTCEPAGDTYIAHHRTATSRGAAHRFLEQTFAPGQ